MLDVGGPLLQMIGAMLQQRVVFLKVSVSNDCEHSNNRKEHDEDVVGVCDKSGCRPPKYGPLPIVQKEITTEEEEVLDDEEH